MACCVVFTTSTRPATRQHFWSDRNFIQPAYIIILLAECDLVCSFCSLSVLFTCHFLFSTTPALAHRVLDSVFGSSYCLSTYISSEIMLIFSCRAPRVFPLPVMFSVTVFFLLDFPTIHLSFYFACFIYSLCCPVGFIYDPGEWLCTPKKSTTKSGFVDIYEQDWGKKQSDNVLTLKTHCEDIMVGLAAMSRSLLPGLTSPASGAPWRWLLWWWGVLGDPSMFCVARAVWDTFIEMAMNLNFRTMMLLEFYIHMFELCIYLLEYF